jgi:glucose/arabinose dehydrogenase
MRARGLLAWATIGVVAGGAFAAYVLVSASGGSRAAAQTPSATTAAAPRAPVPAVKLKLIVSGLSQPMGVTAPPGDTTRLFVVEKTGAIRVIQNGKLLPTAFLNIGARVSGGSEQGLLSLAFDPHYASNGRFYIFYTNRSGDIRVVRYVVSSGDPNVANAGSAKILLKVAHHAHPNHNGGQLAFGPDGRLYIGIGDGGSEGDPNNYGQNKRVRYAKIWRLNVTSPGARPVLYAYGLRNPWRFSFDSKTGSLWIGDVGQNTWEEVDFLKASTTPGTNFGWSYYEGRQVYKPQPIDRGRLVFPAAVYSHSFGCAVIGGYVYRGSAIPALRGDYLFSDECSGRVWFKTSRTASKQILTGISQKVARVTSFGQDATGELYLTSLNGTVYKIVP